ncbi:unnamed protein product [Polarella glacialis]|uniref:Uncharacterized protein n=1 Tax=Polarella glacialis TaxID=89957 RepID=A0A813F9Q0_POLGL|nr:unnamed protein product [Polarella glacialis]
MECSLFPFLNYHFLVFDNISRQCLFFVVNNSTATEMDPSIAPFLCQRYTTDKRSSRQLLFFVSHGLSLPVTVISPNAWFLSSTVCE